MRVLVLLACGLALGGCATVIRGTTEPLVIETSPPGADVKVTFLPTCDRACVEAQYPDQALRMEPDKPPISGAPCVTPCTVVVPRNLLVALAFAKQGYEPFSMKLEPAPSAGGAAGFVGNAVLGGVGGAVVDLASGAGLDHCPNPVQITMRRVGSREPAPPINMTCKGPDMSGAPVPVVGPN